jgi:hypothetical protein
MSLKGGPQLRARLKALKQAFKPIGRKWGDHTVEGAKRRVPVRTGKLKQSIRVRHNSMKRTTVGAMYYGIFIEKGTKAHSIKPKKARSLVFQGRHGTIFAKKVNHPRVGARPFAAPAAREALQANPMAEAIIEEWNRAAP